jgi:hypothetical protein
MLRTWISPLVFCGASMIILTVSVGYSQTAQPSNSTVTGPASAAPIAVKITPPPGEMAGLSAVMHSSHNVCYLEDMVPDDNSSMFMLCGVGQEKTIFEP